MEDIDEPSYAPQSPDLTATTVQDQFEPHPQHREYRGSVSYAPFDPASETKPPFAFNPPPSAHANYTSQQHPQQSPYYHNQQISPTQSPYGQIQQYNTYFSGTVQLQQSSQFDPPQDHQYPYQQSFPEHVKQEDSRVVMPDARSNKKMKMGDEVENNAPGVREGIEVRTKFPVARIKRIMQADEDVGKVAQVTPVAVSKALELFMISLVTKAAAQAREKGSKRVLAQHLKQAVMEDDQFDYLSDIVSKVAEAPSKNADKQEDSDEPMDAPPKRKRAAGGGRKKRKDTDEF